MRLSGGKCRLCGGRIIGRGRNCLLVMAMFGLMPVAV
jgi:hypothetical protein